MYFMDIERRSKSSYMLIVSEDTEESVQKDLTEFIENYQIISIKTGMDADEVRDKVDYGLQNYDNPIIIVKKYHSMNEDLQKFISQYLKHIAEEYVDVPIIVYDNNGNNLVTQNPDLSMRVYKL